MTIVTIIGIDSIGWGLRLYRVSHQRLILDHLLALCLWVSLLNLSVLIGKV